MGIVSKNSPFFCILFLTIFILGCNNKDEKTYNCIYTSIHHPYILKTDFDTSNCNFNRIGDFGGETEIRSDYCPDKVIQYFFWGPRQPPKNVYGWFFIPFSNYEYDTEFVKNRMKWLFKNEHVYYVKLIVINGKKFISTAHESYKLGLTFESNYFNDSMVFVLQTVFRNQYDTSKIDMNLHYNILENSIVTKE